MAYALATASIVLASIAISLLIAFLIALFLIDRSKTITLLDKHVLITGGSRGIGYSTAKDALKRGAKVTIVARNEGRLREAVAELSSLTTDASRRIHWFSFDLTQAEMQFDALAQKVADAESELGPIDVLINNAGTPADGIFENTDVSRYRIPMELNYFSVVAMSKAVLPSMLREGGPKNPKRIMIVSSMAGQVGLYGYSAYSGTKFALRGFAESLRMELKPHHIAVGLVFPPDTETDSLAEELKTRSKETNLISGQAGVFQPSDIAEKLLDSACAGHWSTYYGLEGWMLATLTAGMAPATGPFELLEQCFLMGLLRFVSLFYLRSFNNIVLKCAEERKREESSGRS